MGSRVGRESGGESSVVMVQAAYVRDLDDLTLVGVLDLMGLGTIHLQRPMNAPSVIVGEVTLEYPFQVPLIHHDDVVEALPPD